MQFHTHFFETSIGEVVRSTAARSSPEIPTEPFKKQNSRGYPVQNNLRVSPNRKPAAKIQIDAEVFLLAVHSYPERFHRQPAVTFEQHFLSLVAASQSRLTQAHAAGS